MDKMTELRNARERLAEALQLISVALERGKLTSIDRDLLLEKLRKVYDDLTFERTAESNQIQAFQQNLAVQPAVEPQKREAVKPAPPAAETKSEPVRVVMKTEAAKRAEAKPREELAPAVPEVEAEEIKKPEASISESAMQHVAPAHAPVQGEILADKFKDSRKYRNESIGAPKKDVASRLQNKPIGDLTKAIGINDKFLYTKELFNGNAELYASTIKRLNEFTDINDALIFVQENFQWDENNDAANRLLELVRRKLLAN